MDSIFNLQEAERSNLLRNIIQSCGFTYVCLWSHLPHHSNCLVFIDGVYKEEKNNEASSPSGTLAMRSFLDYQKSMFLIDNYSGGVPGYAFMHNLTYIEHTGLELLELASSSAQLQFYQEAKITTAIFMGCKNGEIELGMSNGSSQVINQFELKKLFPGDFPQELLPQPVDQARPSSSSLSLRPFSNQQMPNQTPISSTRRLKDPLHQALIPFRAIQLIPSIEHEEATMIKAFHAIISRPSSCQIQAQRASAFKRYRTYLGPTNRVQNQQNFNRRLLLFYKNLSEARAQHEDLIIHTTRPTSGHFRHMIYERKRREKLNDCFQALRSLLPPGSKMDKASVLSNIKDYVASLTSQVEELNKRNKILENEHPRMQILNHDSGERLDVRIVDLDESTSDLRVVDLEVNVNRNLILSDLVVRVLEFMKQVKNVTVTSINAETRMLQTEVTMNRVILRLRIQGSEWNRSSFQEALTRVLDDLTQ